MAGAKQAPSPMHKVRRAGGGGRKHRGAGDAPGAHAMGCAVVATLGAGCFRALRAGLKERFSRRPLWDR